MDNDVLNDQTPPQNVAAEKAVLGAIFLNGEALIEAMEFVSEGDFYRHAHQIIFHAMVTLNDRDEAIDAVTVTDLLEAENQLEDVGGLSYITELAGAVPTAANAAYYAKIVAQKSTVRRLIKTTTDILQKAYSDNDDVPGLLDDAERQIMSVSEDRSQNGFQSIVDILNTTMDDIDKLSQNNDDITGLPTGFGELDKMTAGLQPDNLIILAARPAVGKTAFALNIAQNVGTKTDKTVAVFSLEMSAQSLVSRMLCAEGSIDASHLRTGQLSAEEWQNLVVAMGSLSRAHIFIDDTPGIKMSEIRAKTRRLAKEQGNLGLVVVDYMQLIEGSNQESRQQEVSEISRQMKKLAKELSIPVIALSQLSRSVEQRQDKRPMLSDIRESGSIEQDADIVAFLYRDDYYRDEDGEDGDGGGGGGDFNGSDPRDDESDNVSEVEVIIEKNRAGARGTVKLLFVKSFNKFSSVSYADDPAPS